MVLPHGTGDLYHKYRPQRFNEIYGHKEVVSSLKKAISAEDPAHAYLLIGSSGTGKTTSARIMALTLNCEEVVDGEPCLSCASCKIILSGSCIDVIEKNAAEHRGIDAVREISQTMSLMPMNIKNKIYILDEFHQMTKEAQTCLLKVLEEAPRNVFIILCTTHQTKVIPTIRNRCQNFRFSSLNKKEIKGLLEEIITYETFFPAEGIVDYVAEAASGSPRQALVLMQQVIQLGKPTLAEVKRLLNIDEEDPDVIKLCFSLTDRRVKWDKLMSLYKDLKDMGAPAIGMVCAGYFRNRLIGAKDKMEADKWAKFLKLFLHPFDDGKLGENQLMYALYEAKKILGG